MTLTHIYSATIKMKFIMRMLAVTVLTPTLVSATVVPTLEVAFIYKASPFLISLGRAPGV